MRLQRAGVAESPVEMQLVKWTAEGMVKGETRVFHDVCTRKWQGVCQYSYKSVPFGSKARWYRGVYSRPWSFNKTKDVFDYIKNERVKKNG
jgi:hypothetical protein